MTTDKKPPILSIRDRNLSVSVFERKSKDGKDYLSVCVQRGYKNEAGEWARESINTFPDNLPRLILLLQKVYSKLLDREQNKKSDNQPTDNQASKEAGWDAQPASTFDDDIPF